MSTKFSSSHDSSVIKLIETSDESDKCRGPNIFLGPSLDSFTGVQDAPRTHSSMQLLSEANLSGLQDVVHIGTAGIVTSIEKSPPSFSIHATQVTCIALRPIIVRSSESYHKANVLSLVADIALARVAHFLLANLSGEQPGAANFSLALDVDVGRVELELTYHRPLLFGRQERTPWQPLFLASDDDVETFE
ncbi:hypothetical protein EDB85DRAFT_1896809 [Lactarius pseudohatsudake]|nr:hypothetical protein EDB85DRAFT_1896809 [Lactarius pseudohatsudake]